MTTKKTTRTVKPKLNKADVIKEVEAKLNSMEKIDRFKLAGQLKNGKINLNFML